MSEPRGAAPVRRLVFATRNAGKLTELRLLLTDLAGDIEVLSALDMALPEVVEDAPTFAGNAAKKAREVSVWSGLPALADDSGLEVDALAGAPGVISARYAGPEQDDRRNNQKLLAALMPPAEDETAAIEDVDLGEEVPVEGEEDDVFLEAEEEDEAAVPDIIGGPGDAAEEES